MAQLLSQKYSLAYEGKPALLLSVLNAVEYVINWFSICALELSLSGGWFELSGVGVVTAPWCSRVFKHVTVLCLLVQQGELLQKHQTAQSNTPQKELCYGRDCRLWWLIVVSLEYFPSVTVWMLFVNRCSAGILFPMLCPRINTYFIFEVLWCFCMCSLRKLGSVEETGS